MTEHDASEPASSAKTWLPWAGLLVLAAPVVGHISLALTMLVSALVIAILAWWVRPPALAADLLATRRTWLLGLVALPGGLQLTEALRMPPSGLRLLAVFSYAGAVAAVLASPRATLFRRMTVAQLWVLLQMVLFITVIQVNAHSITDVWVFLTDGARAVLHGVNPYALTFPNIYPDRLAHLFYGSGVVVGGRVVYGFPYTPPSAIWAAVGYVFGDVRISGAIALCLLSLVLSGAKANQRSRVCAVLFLVAPTTVPVLTGAWTEASVVVVLALAVWALRIRRLTAASVLVGLFLVSKQYVVVTLPCLWLLRGLITRRHLLVVAGTGLGLTLPLMLVNPHAFWRSVVEWQFIQPFRADSLSLLAPLVNYTGWPSPAVYGVLPLVAGLLVAVIFTLGVRAGPAQYASGVGLSLLTTVLLSKQAFLNYYFLIGGAFLIAAWAAGSGTSTEGVYTFSARAQSPVPKGRMKSQRMQPGLPTRARPLSHRAYTDRRVRFVIVGAWNTLFGLAVFSGLTLILRGNLHYLLILVIGHVLATGQGFVLHRRAVYRVGGSRLRDFARFQVVYTAVLGANTLVLFGLVNAGLPLLLSQSITVSALSLATYFVHLHFTFYRAGVSEGPRSDSSRSATPPVASTG